MENSILFDMAVWPNCPRLRLRLWAGIFLHLLIYVSLTDSKSLLYHKL